MRRSSNCTSFFARKMSSWTLPPPKITISLILAALQAIYDAVKKSMTLSFTLLPFFKFMSIANYLFSELKSVVEIFSTALLLTNCTTTASLTEVIAIPALEDVLVCSERWLWFPRLWCFAFPLKCGCPCAKKFESNEALIIKLFAHCCRACRFCNDAFICVFGFHTVSIAEAK